MAVPFFGARRASIVPQLSTDDVRVDADGWGCGFGGEASKERPTWIRQLSNLPAGAALGDACLVRLPSGRLRLRSLVRTHRDHSGRMSGPAPNLPGWCSPLALFVGLARPSSGPGMATSGVAAAWGKSFGVRVVSPLGRDARVHLINGMRGWEAPRASRVPTMGWGGP